jgi:hypothetical protein
VAVRVAVGKAVAVVVVVVETPRGLKLGLVTPEQQVAVTRLVGLVGLVGGLVGLVTVSRLVML